MLDQQFGKVINLFKTDARLLIFLLAISFVSVYFMPSLVNRLVFLLILFTAWRTRFDYVYFVWFLIITDAPGRLFSAGTADAAMRIPLYTLAGGLSLSFQDLFIILFILKYLTSNKDTYFFLKIEFQLFLIVLALYLVYSLFLGVGYNEFVRISRILLPWSFIFIIPAYIQDREIMIRASRLLFPVVFVAFTSQVYTFITGNYWDYHLRGEEFRSLLAIDAGRGVSRSYSAVYIIFICTIQALYYLFEKNKNEFSKNYLSAVIFISTLSILLTATRGWIIAYSILLIGVLVIFGASRDISKLLRMGLTAIVLFLILTTQLPFLKTQMEMVFERLTTLERLIEGDVTAGGTLGRIDQRGSRVLSQFKESPVLGWGFSKNYFEYVDTHVGHHTILLNTGIIGYAYLNLLFFYILFKILQLNSIAGQQNNRAIWIYIFAMLSVYVIHSSSTVFWGFHIATNNIMVIALILTAVNTVYMPNINNK